MKNKISHQGVVRAAKYAQKAIEEGDNLVSALERGRELEKSGRLSADGSLQKTHPDAQQVTR
tara:strand:- start:571 stop:756 length:186 start_codon:yes stop_codon:yes gene_type:complete